MTEAYEYYNEIAATYNELYGEEQKKKAKVIKEEFERLGLTEGNLLDVGGGTGIATEVFTDHFDCVLVDPAEKLLEVASPSALNVLGMAEELPFSDDKFDAVISLTALHHADINQALEEIRRVAKPEALIAISFLRRSEKLNEFRETFSELFPAARELEEERDIIFFSE